MLNSLERQRTFGLKELKGTQQPNAVCELWELAPDMIKSMLNFFFFCFLRWGILNQILSDLWHYYFFRDRQDRSVGIIFFKSPYHLVIDTELVMGEIMMSGICFKLIQSEQGVGQGKKKQDFQYMIIVEGRSQVCGDSNIFECLKFSQQKIELYE